MNVSDPSKVLPEQNTVENTDMDLPLRSTDQENADALGLRSGTRTRNNYGTRFRVQYGTRLRVRYGLRAKNATESVTVTTIRQQV